MTGADAPRTLVAGIGNIFLTDDGFGVEAVRAVEPGSLPAGVDVADYGIRGVHLAYELLGGRYDALVMIDAVPLGEAPGTLAVLDVSGYEHRAEFADWAGQPVDAHSMQPEVVLAALRNLGGAIGRVYVVGCQPAALDEGIGLTPAVAAAVPGAVALVRELVAAQAAPAGLKRLPREVQRVVHYVRNVRGRDVHELGLCEGIVAAAARRAGDRRVRGLRVRVGGHPVDPGVIRQGVELAAVGTVVEGAVLDLVLEPLVAHCRDCGHDGPASDAAAMTACARCGGLDIELGGSEQVMLESISVAAAEEAQT